jgi:hypothetical protein
MITFPPLLLALVILVLGYLRAARDLPPLDSEFDIEKGLRTTIEGERRHLRPEAGIIHNEVRWPRPTLADFPHDFVAIQVAVWRCPTFFQTVRESELEWALRVLKAQVLNRGSTGRDGKCELHFARDVASHLRVAEGAAQNLAAYRIRQVLGRDQLVAYDLAAMPLERGYFGVQDAARLFLHRDLTKLSLAELAELSIALPPYNMYDEIRDCVSPLAIKQTRDDLLLNLGETQVLSLDKAKAASGEPLACQRR